ncbi:MAG: Uma2 family endonuclease [Candidatus Contendobacter sp.]|nr:Uma2 family endonuclease [Candidatus Contendobacter sp.]MDG4557245.1 Uma2 family endonuclease [Candidatus Contendobacter sp.]
MTPHKITPAEYHQMGAIFPDVRLELIEGELFDMAPIGTLHAWTVGHLTRLLTLRLAEQAFIFCQSPLALPDSEPEPDIMVLKLADYRQRLPEPGDVRWLIEVADSSVRYDRTRKLPLYARHGIPEAWLIDLNARVVEVHRQPVGDCYQTVATPNVLTPLAFPELAIPVEDILP